MTPVHTVYIIWDIICILSWSLTKHDLGQETYVVLILCQTWSGTIYICCPYSWSNLICTDGWIELTITTITILWKFKLIQPKNENQGCRVLSHHMKTDFVEWSHALEQLTQPKNENPDCRVLTHDIKKDFVEWSHALEQLTQPKKGNPGCRVLTQDLKTECVEWSHAKEQLIQPKNENTDCRVRTQGITTDSVEWPFSLWRSPSHIF